MYLFFVVVTSVVTVLFTMVVLRMNLHAESKPLVAMPAWVSIYRCIIIIFIANFALKFLECSTTFVANYRQMSDNLFLPECAKITVLYVHMRIQFKLAMLVFRSLHGLASQYL